MVKLIHASSIQCFWSLIKTKNQDIDDLCCLDFNQSLNWGMPIVLGSPIVWKMSKKTSSSPSDRPVLVVWLGLEINVRVKANQRKSSDGSQGITTMDSWKNGMVFHFLSPPTIYQEVNTAGVAFPLRLNIKRTVQNLGKCAYSLFGMRSLNFNK